MVAKFLDLYKPWSSKYGRKNEKMDMYGFPVTFLTFPCTIALRNKTLATTFFPSFDNADGPSLSRKILEIQKSCYHVNVTSHIYSL